MPKTYYEARLLEFPLDENSPWTLLADENQTEDFPDGIRADNYLACYNKAIETIKGNLDITGEDDKAEANYNYQKMIKSLAIAEIRVSYIFNESICESVCGKVS